MEDVARRAGVSRALVSLALNGSPKVSARSRQAVEAAAQELGYRPNLMARTLASRRTMTIGALLDDLHNPFYADVADGLLTTAAQRGYRVLLTAGLRRGDTQRLAVDTLLQLHVDGIILVSPRFGADEIEQRARHLPFVVVGEPMRSAVVDTVNVDEQAAVELLIEHLRGLGHRSIAHVDGGHGAASTARRTAYTATMTRLGLAHEVRVIGGEFTEQAGLDAAAVLAAGRTVPTAVFAANDLVAAGLIDGLETAGLRVPDDVSVVGFDDTLFAGMRRFSITTIDQPKMLMGALAVETLLARLDAGTSEVRHRVVAPNLVVRRSSAPPPR